MTLSTNLRYLSIMNLETIPNNDDLSDCNRELLIEIVMAQKEQIQKLLAQNIELKIKLESYTNIQNAEIKPIVHIKSNREKK